MPLRHKLRDWLANVPVDDPVDRRNAPFMQLLLLFIGIFLPLNKAFYLYAILVKHWKPLPGLAMDLVTDVLIVAAIWTSLAMIRRGRFRQAVVLFLGTVLLAVAAVYTTQNLSNLSRDPMPLLLLVIGGLVLGRRALWTIFGLLILIVVASLVVSMARGAVPGQISPTAMTGMLISLSGIYLIITILLDRTVAALRESLTEANARGRALEEANLKLQREIQEREQAQERLIHAQKMETVGRIASGVAHDFDNVLNVVLGFAARREQLADQGSSALVRALEGVELAARQALAISRKLLNFSRQDQSRPEVFDAAQALRELQPMLRQLFGADTRVTLETQDAPMPIHMDRGQLELLVLNVAANARDAMPEGGSFTVGARVAADGKTLELELSDTGGGMPASVRQRIFEPFYTTKPAGSGTGLGLAVVRDVITAANGDISVESRPGEGTTFRIILPLA